MPLGVRRKLRRAPRDRCRNPFADDAVGECTSGLIGTDSSGRGYGRRVMEDARPLHRELRHANPEVHKTFGEVHHASFAQGALDVKTKELIASAIAVIQRCDGCVASHSEGAPKLVRPGRS